MVKRLRRRPLTAETGVRFPMGLPKRKDRFLPVLSFWYFLRELSRRAPRGCSRASSAEGTPPGFRQIPSQTLSPSRTGFLPVPFFLVISPGIGRARSGCSRASPAEGAPPGFRPIPHGGGISVPFFLVISPGIGRARSGCSRASPAEGGQKRGGARTLPRKGQKEIRVCRRTKKC